MFVSCEFVCYQVEVSLTDRPFVQRSLNEFRVSECDLETSTTRPIGLSNQEKEIFLSARQLHTNETENASQEGL